MQRISSFEAFWPFYLGEHSKPATRAWHFVGSTLALAVLIGALATGRTWWALGAPVCGYAFAWYSHFFIEGNVPATFGNPLWSLRGDFEMVYRMVTGTMDAEVERCRRTEPEAPAAPATDAVVEVTAASEPTSDPSLN